MFGFQKVEMSDHEFAAKLQKHGWKGKYKQVDIYTQYMRNDGKVLALVKYKNSPPVDRTIYWKEDIDGKD